MINMHEALVSVVQLIIEARYASVTIESKVFITSLHVKLVNFTPFLVKELLN